MRRWLPIALILAFALTGVAEAGKSKLKKKDTLLPDGWPEITDTERALTEVAWSKGQPAVELLRVQEHEWVDLTFMRDRLFRRIKILDETGVEDYGSFTYQLFGDWRVQRVEARTVLPDGTVVDAGDGIHRDESDDEGYHVIRIDFPRVEVGAILDFDIRVNSDALGVAPFTVQRRIPILDARLVLTPPLHLRWRIVPARLPAERTEPDAKFNNPGTDSPTMVWIFEDVPPIPDLAYSPPIEDLSQRLFIILDHYKDEYRVIPIAGDWKTWNESRSEAWDTWLKGPHANSAALATEVTKGIDDPIEKADAIRRALRDRFQVGFRWNWASDDNVDAVLAKGHGTTYDLAALTVTMLRSLGLDACIAAYRPRSEGIVPMDFPVPTMFDSALVRLRAGERELYYDPASDMHVTRLPYDATYVLAMPFDDGVTDRPKYLEDFKSTDNRIVRTAEGTLSATGDLELTVDATYTGYAAENWRDRLRGKTDEQQRERLESSARTWMPGAIVRELKIDNIDDSAADLVLHVGYEVPNYATVAGKRLVFDPNLFERERGTDWAPPTRTFEIELGANYDHLNTLTLRLPDNAGDVQVPQNAKLNAPPVGSYDIVHDVQARTVVSRRHMRLDVHSFPPESYSGLRHWFGDIATNDDKPVVVMLDGK